MSSILARLGLGDSDGRQGLSGDRGLFDRSSDCLALDDRRNNFIIDIGDVLQDSEQSEGHIHRDVEGLVVFATRRKEIRNQASAKSSSWTMGVLTCSQMYSC